jgi:hypothetical protein
MFMRVLLGRKAQAQDGGRKAARYTAFMTKTAKQLLERIASWPDEDIEKLEETARQIEAWRSGEYRATEEEPRAIDQATAELDRGEAATDAQVQATYAKFRDSWAGARRLKDNLTTPRYQDGSRASKR